MKNISLLIVTVLAFIPIVVAEVTVLKPELIFQENENNPNTIFSEPVGFYIDSNEDIYIVDFRDCLVKVFDKTGKFKFSFGKRGSGPSEFMLPHNIWREGENIYVQDKFFVKVFDLKGNYISDYKITKRRTPRSVNLKNSRYVDTTFNIDKKENYIGIFDKNGKELKRIPKTLGDSDDILNYSSVLHLCADSSESIYFTEFHRLKVIKYKNGKNKILLERDYQPRPFTEQEKKSFVERIKKAAGGREFRYNIPQIHTLIRDMFIDEYKNLYFLIDSTTFQGIEKYDKNGKYVKSYVFPERKSVRFIQKTIKNNYVYAIDYSTEEGLKIYKVKFE